MHKILRQKGANAFRICSEWRRFIKLGFPPCFRISDNYKVKIKQNKIKY
jgi:hypothetical protein